MRNILVAGGTGRVGRQVVERLVARGLPVRRLVRSPAPRVAGADDVLGDVLRPASLNGALREVDVVFSAVGASLDPRRVRDRRSFHAVDLRGNRALLTAAEGAGVPRFVYVSAHAVPELARTAYADAHLRFEEALAASGVRGAVVAPTGLFYVFLEFLAMARRGRGVVIGSGQARTNPIHEGDVADVCVERILGAEGPSSIGGPEVFTRREITDLAFQVLGAEPRRVRVPPLAMRAAAAALRPWNRRISELLSFGVAAATHDVVAPAVGSRTLREYFADHAKRPPGPATSS